MVRIVIAAVFLAVGSLAVATEIQAPARVTRCYDGDTCTVEAQAWPGFVWHGNVRVSGVDTPEIGSGAGCAEEKVLGKAARDFVLALIDELGDEVLLVDVQDDKYGGRVVARVQLGDGTDLADRLIEAGHGLPYDGGTRPEWCSPTEAAA